MASVFNIKMENCAVCLLSLLVLCMFCKGYTTNVGLDNQFYLNLKTPPSKDFSHHTIITPKIYHGREKRQISNTKEEDGQHTHFLTIGYTSDGSEQVLDLQLNRELIPDNFFVRYQQNGKPVINRPTGKDIELCHYVGVVRGKEGSWAAVSTCKGLKGVVFDGTTMHYLHPSDEDDLESAHYLYKHNHLMTEHKCGYKSGLHSDHNDTHQHDHFHESPNTVTHSTVSGGLDGNHEFNRILRYKRSIRDEPKIRGPYNANKLSRYVELVLVVDNKEYKELGESLNNVYRHCKDISNIINSLYAPLNIFIALTGIVVWSDFDEIQLSDNGDSTLTNFLHYRREKLLKDHPNDNAQLLTREQFTGGVVGKALKGPICTFEFSGGVAMDHSNVVGLVATTVAHEMGHNFGMEHDTENCKCPDERCIMSPSSNSQSPTHWSTCSLEYLALAFEHGMDYCLRNKPTRLFDSPVCGNGFVEPGEQCDCGLSSSCKNNHCCDPATCMLFPNATCATGECCDLETCRPSNAGKLCRSADHECDLPEYCTGQSEFCPDDVFKMDSETCDYGKAFCYKGSCRTRNDQCRLLWGPSGESSDDQCYDMNKKGTRHGNCGYDRLKKHFNLCQDTNKFCGMLHCRHLNERLEFGMESVSILSHSFINSKGSIIPCRTAIVDLGLTQVDPGLVPDGAKCGEGKMCVNQKCMPVASLRMNVQSNTDAGAVCPSDCSGNGVCNSLGHCHCHKGFAPPLCKLPGPGGSLDSGPASDPNAQKKVAAGLLIFFLGIVPGIVVIVFAVYYCKHNSLIGLKKPKNPMSKSPGKSGTRPSCFGLSSSPSPPSSTSPLSHSVPPMSPDDMNSSLLPEHGQDSALNPNFFGQFKGFALFPIQKGDDSFGNQNYKENEPSAPPTVSSFSPTSPNTNSVKNMVNNLNRSTNQTAQINRGPSFTTPRSPTHKVPQRSAPPVPSVPTVAIHLKKTNNVQVDAGAIDKVNNINKDSFNRPKSVASGVENITTASVAPALPPLNPGLQSSRPLISNPILEGSTCTAKELISPLKHCNKNIPPVINNVPLRAAPSAPVTLPVSGTLSPTSSKRPLSSPNSVTNAIMQIPEENSTNTLKKNKEGNTLNRIASFLKSEKEKSRTPVERSNSLPKNPNHVVKIHKSADKNELRKLPISNPILQKEIELPATAMPVLSDSEDESKINVTRAQSMRGPQTAPRPNISSFGSMRQAPGTKRPTSIAVSNRPTSPPPPIPVETKIKSDIRLPTYQNQQQKEIKMSEYADCMAETQAPLANINEETTPDNIYSIIEESPPIGSAKNLNKPKSIPNSNNSSPENLANVTAGSTDSMGLLGEIVSEIQNRNFDSIYSTSTLARKKKEKEERERLKQIAINGGGGGDSDFYDSTTYANTSEYRSPETEYSNLSDGSKNISSAASTTSSGYLTPAAVNVPVGAIPPMSGIVSIGEVSNKTPPKLADPPTFKKADEVDKYKPFASTFHRSLGPFASSYTIDKTNPTEKKNEKVTTPTNITQKQFPSKVPLVRQNTPEKLLDKPNISRQITPPNLKSPPGQGVTLRNSFISKNNSADRLSSANSPDLVSSCATATKSVKSPDVVNGNGSATAGKISGMNQGVILKPSLQSLPAKPPPQPQKNSTNNISSQKPLVKQNSKGSLSTSMSTNAADSKPSIRNAPAPPASTAANSSDKKKIVPPRPILPKVLQNGVADKNNSSNNLSSNKSNSVEKNLSSLSKTNMNDVKPKQPIKPVTNQKTDSVVGNVKSVNGPKTNSPTKGASNVANLQQKFEPSKVGVTTNRAPIVSLKKL